MPEGKSVWDLRWWVREEGEGRGLMNSVYDWILWLRLCKGSSSHPVVRSFPHHISFKWVRCSSIMSGWKTAWFHLCPVCKLYGLGEIPITHILVGIWGYSCWWQPNPGNTGKMGAGGYGERWKSREEDRNRGAGEEMSTLSISWESQNVLKACT